MIFIKTLAKKLAFFTFSFFHSILFSLLFYKTNAFKRTHIVRKTYSKRT